MSAAEDRLEAVREAVKASGTQTWMESARPELEWSEPVGVKDRITGQFLGYITSADKHFVIARCQVKGEAVYTVWKLDRRQRWLLGGSRDLAQCKGWCEAARDRVPESAQHYGFGARTGWFDGV